MSEIPPRDKNYRWCYFAVCTYCGAVSGYPCIGPRGQWTVPHMKRVYRASGSWGNRETI